MKLFLSMLIIFFSLFMFFLNHPLSMGLMILIQTLIICLLSGMMIKTYWFSYILFLTFLGGLLVLFIYVTSIASNEMFYPSMLSKFMIFFFLILLVNFSFLSYKFNWMNLYFNMEMENFSNLFIFINNENKINLTKMYNNHTFLLMIMLIIYLFITLMVVVKITNIFYGPLRMSN